MVLHLIQWQLEVVVAVVLEETAHRHHLQVVVLHLEQVAEALFDSHLQYSEFVHQSF